MTLFGSTHNIMYRMKRIIPPAERSYFHCMYSVKNSMKFEDMEIDICYQERKTELEERQDLLLARLDTLNKRIENIRFLSKSVLITDQERGTQKSKQILEQEIVLYFNPDILPWFLNVFLKGLTGVNISWHIHSTVTKEKIPIIYSFLKNLKTENKNVQDRINLRLIFTNVQSIPELKASSLDIPIIGTVNIIRFMCLQFKDIVPYDFSDHDLEGLLDMCFLLERISDKNKEGILKKLFIKCKPWIYKNEFSIADVAAYNVIKQSQKSVKHVPQQWYEVCDKKIN